MVDVKKVFWGDMICVHLGLKKSGGVESKKVIEEQ